ncbi:MAG: hypothetical protein U0Q16_20435 [Bryobacteraceae bacterium]
MRISALVLAASLLATAQTKRKTDSPLDHLPKNIEVITHFGERADFAPGNQAVAFMAKSFGDAFTIDLKTRHVRCLTCSIPGAAFLRVMHLPSGDYILIGAEKFTDIRTSRREHNELWFLSKQPGSLPVKLSQKMSEGAAISKTAMKISFSVTSAQDPSLPEGHSRLILADVDIAGHKLTNKKTIYESTSRGCVLEAQDFYDNDRQMTFTCYEPQGKGSVWTLDIASGKATKQTNLPGRYNEVEGIIPPGQYTLVESDEQAKLYDDPGGFRQIDIWKLKLDGSGKDFTRLTYFNDYEGWKASNPVVSTDGKVMAFQIAKTKDEAGVGYGICLYRFK